MQIGWQQFDIHIMANSIINFINGNFIVFESAVLVLINAILIISAMKCFKENKNV